MAKITILDPLGNGRKMLGHSHYLRDWSGSFIPLYTPFPPLDQMYAASYLIEKGHDVKIIESSVKHITHKKTVKILQEDPPDFVLIPSTLLSMEDDKYLARQIKKNLPETKIVFSGPLVTYDPSLVLSDNCADFVALGELELPMLGIVNKDYTYNIAYVDGDNIVKGKRILIDLKELPSAARDLVDNDAYKYALFNRKNPVASMIISRGCPHSKCKFCYSMLFTLGQIRYRPFESIMEEIKEIVYKYKAGEIFFRDQAFTSNRELVMKICKYLISNNIKILWRASTRVDLVDKELLIVMKKAGCYQISLGFESYSQNALDENAKGITLMQSINAAKWAKEAGIELLGFFMTGMKGEKFSSLKKIADFAIYLDVDFAQFNSAYVTPGCQIYEDYGRRSFYLYDRRYLNKICRNAYLKFYLRPKKIIKLISTVNSLNKAILSIRTALNAIFFVFYGKS